MWRLSGRVLTIFFSFLSFPDEMGKSYILSNKSLLNRWLRAGPRTDYVAKCIRAISQLLFCPLGKPLTTPLFSRLLLHPQNKWEEPAEPQTHEHPASP